MKRADDEIKPSAFDRMMSDPVSAALAYLMVAPFVAIMIAGAIDLIINAWRWM